MTVSLFEQFYSPSLLGLPLIALALAFPWVLFPSPSSRLLNGRLVSFQNWFIGRFTQQIFQAIPSQGHKWAVVFTALMLNLVALNMLGLLPYTFTPTTQLSMNMAFAVPFWLATVTLGMKDQTTRTLGHLLPEGTPLLLIPLLIIIETISLLIRPLALGVRLTANLTAGHLLIHLTSSASFVLITMMPPVAFFTVGLLFLLSLLEIAVAMIQAYVFVLLLSLYLQENV